MLQLMSWEQLYGWFEYFQLEPFGEERADLRAGSIVAATYNVNLKSNAKPFSPSDCALRFHGPLAPAPVLTPEQEAAAARSRFDAYKQMVIAVATQ